MGLIRVMIRVCITQKTRMLVPGNTVDFLPKQTTKIKVVELKELVAVDLPMH